MSAHTLFRHSLGLPELPLALNYVDAVEGTGLTLTATQKQGVSIFVYRLIQANLVSKMYAIHLYIGGTAAAQKFNLMNPVDTDAATRLVFTGSPIHSATGFKPNGSSQYANTFFTPSARMVAANGQGITTYTRTVGSGGGYVMGAFVSGAVGLILSGRNTAGTSVTGQNGGTTVTAPTALIGASRLSINRIPGTTVKLYQNGALLASAADSYSGLPTVPIYLGCINSGGPSQYSNLEICFSAIHDGLTATEVAAFDAAILELNTTLGRAV